MVWAKSTQTEKVGIITDQMHLYILFSSKYDEKCVGMNSVSYPYYSCLCTFWPYHPYLLF